MNETKIIRCAIYTRKSTEEGLEKEFNSLQAQRESAEAYVQSQRSEGWIVLPKQYDDGGYSGGNMERPALKELMKDIENGLVDSILVYKVDRLSRSLLDFASLIAFFDKHNVTFTSVTQSFCTTTSMGRLTLNILLSFAQFEREIIGERIRDKISAAKKKGKYTGGHPILGYDSDNAKLFVNETEAKTVKQMFRRFLVLRSTLHLAKELNRDGILAKSWTSANGKVHLPRPWNKTSVYTVLTNRKYIGEITHFDKVFPGEHEAIIDRKTWSRVQTIFTENSHVRATASRCRTPAMLKGILRCGHCDSSMGLTYTKRNGRTYRYYQCLAASKQGYDSCPVKAVPAGDIESAVFGRMREILQTPEVIAQAQFAAKDLKTPPDPQELAIALRNVDTVWEHLFPAEQARICMLLVKQATVNSDGLEIHLSHCGIDSLAAEFTDNNNVNETAQGSEQVKHKDGIMVIRIPMKFHRRGGRKEIILPEGMNESSMASSLQVAIATAYRWQKMLDTAEVKSVTELATQMNMNKAHVSRMLRLTLLAPDIVEAILAGKEPEGLSITRLRDHPIPLLWEDQRKLYGFCKSKSPSASSIPLFTSLT